MIKLARVSGMLADCSVSLCHIAGESLKGYSASVIVPKHDSLLFLKQVHLAP